MNSNVHFVSDFNARELHQGGIEDDPLEFPTLVMVFVMT